MRYNEFLKQLEKAKNKTGVENPYISISSFINENKFIEGDIEISTSSTFEKKPKKSISILTNYKNTRN